MIDIRKYKQFGCQVSRSINISSMIIKADSDLRFGRERRVPVSGQVVAVVGVVRVVQPPGGNHQLLVSQLPPASQGPGYTQASDAFNSHHML